MIVGVDGIEGTPVPIPNTEVKLNYAEDTWAATPRENRKVPTLFRDSRFLRLSFFIVHAR